MMKKLFLIYLLFPMLAHAQVMGTPQLNVNKNSGLDTYASSMSFALSVRKVLDSYTGFCCKIVQNGTNAEADVSFNADKKFNLNSTVTITAVGTSSYTLGQQMSFAVFSPNLTVETRVKTWYDQSGNARNATQATYANMPFIALGNGGALCFQYAGTQNLPVTATPAQILGTTSGAVAGVVGTAFVIAFATTADQNSFGFKDGSDRRWAAHLNFLSSLLYFDAGELCCASLRNFSNVFSNSKWRQYTLQRQSLVKIVRISGTQFMNGNGAAAAAATSTSFGIGNWTNLVVNGFVGNYQEFILFNTAPITTDLQIIKKNQVQALNCG